jgi:hypothetical protein
MTGYSSYERPRQRQTTKRIVPDPGDVPDPRYHRCKAGGARSARSVRRSLRTIHEGDTCLFPALCSHKTCGSTRRGTSMKLNVRAFAHAAALVWTALYALCALLIALAPKQTVAAFGYVMHADLSLISRSVTWDSFLAGLVSWYLLVALSTGAAVWLYNRFANTAEAVSGKTKTPIDLKTIGTLP